LLPQILTDETPILSVRISFVCACGRAQLIIFENKKPASTVLRPVEKVKNYYALQRRINIIKPPNAPTATKAREDGSGIMLSWTLSITN
jgi:hypothetical protein